jgi:hypothetical protein
MQNFQIMTFNLTGLSHSILLNSLSKANEFKPKPCDNLKMVPKLKCQAKNLAEEKLWNMEVGQRVHAVATAVTEQAAQEIIKKALSDAGVKDFYSLYLLNTCEGNSTASLKPHMILCSQKTMFRMSSIILRSLFS